MIILKDWKIRLENNSVLVMSIPLRVCNPKDDSLAWGRPVLQRIYGIMKFEAFCYATRSDR